MVHNCSSIRNKRDVPASFGIPSFFLKKVVFSLIYSFSRLSQYENCPFRFYLKYVEGREEPVTKPLALGKAVHVGIEKRIQGYTLEDAIVEGYIATGFHPEVERTEMESLIKKAPVETGMGETEVHFELPLSPSPSAPKIQGFIDLVVEDETGVWFADWKTNWQQYGVFDSMQVSLYAWALMEMKGLDEVYGTLYFLRFGQDDGHKFSRDEAEKARQWAYDTVMDIENKLFLLDIGPEAWDRLFPATPSSHCKHCPFALECYQQFGVGF